MEIGNPNLNMNGDVTNRVNVENFDVKKKLKLKEKETEIWYFNTC